MKQSSNKYSLNIYSIWVANIFKQLWDRYPRNKSTQSTKRKCFPTLHVQAYSISSHTSVRIRLICDICQPCRVRGPGSTPQESNSVTHELYMWKANPLTLHGFSGGKEQSGRNDLGSPLMGLQTQNSTNCNLGYQIRFLVCVVPEAFSEQQQPLQNLLKKKVDIFNGRSFRRHVLEIFLLK